MWNHKRALLCYHSSKDLSQRHVTVLNPIHFFSDKITNENASPERTSDEDFTYPPVRPVMKRPKLRLIPTPSNLRNGLHRESVFEPTKFKSDKCIRIKIKNCRTQVLRPIRTSVSNYVSNPPYSGVVVASGLLNRFRYKLNKSSDPFPIFGAVLL